MNLWYSKCRLEKFITSPTLNQEKVKHYSVGSRFDNENTDKYNGFIY